MIGASAVALQERIVGRDFFGAPSQRLQIVPVVAAKLGTVLELVRVIAILVFRATVVLFATPLRVLLETLFAPVRRVLGLVVLGYDGPFVARLGAGVIDSGREIVLVGV